MARKPSRYSRTGCRRRQRGNANFSALNRVTAHDPDREDRPANDLTDQEQIAALNKYFGFKE